MNGKKVFLTWLVIPLLAAVCAAQETGLNTLSLAYGAASGEIPGLRAVNAGAITDTANFLKPDADTLAALAKRIPGLDTQNLLAVPFEDADALMQQAADAKDTYLDVFSAQYLQSGGGKTYYFSRDVLARIEAKYAVSGLPISGVTKTRKPFRMEAIVAGEGRVNFLYDQAATFSVMDGKDEMKFTNAGKVEYQIQGPADVAIKGFSGCGCVAIFCGCAEIQRMTKISPSQMHVATSRGLQTESLTPVRPN